MTEEKKEELTERKSTRILEHLVRKHMENYGLTQDQMCALSGGMVNRNMLQPLLNGERRSISVWMLAGLARAMHLPPSALMGRMGLRWSTDAPYGEKIERGVLAFDHLWTTAPDDEREELADAILELTNRFASKRKTGQQKG